MLQNQSFTDPQGQHFDDAVIRVKNASYNKSWNGSEEESFSINLKDLSAEPTTSTNDYSHEYQEIRVEFVYWVSQAAYDENKTPYSLVNTLDESLSNSFYIQSEELKDTKYDGLTLEEKCELFLTESILPNL